MPTYDPKNVIVSVTHYGLPEGTFEIIVDRFQYKPDGLRHLNRKIRFKPRPLDFDPPTGKKNLG